jgi:hypothetical protein
LYLKSVDDFKLPIFLILKWHGNLAENTILGIPKMAKGPKWQRTQNGKIPKMAKDPK